MDKIKEKIVFKDIGNVFDFECSLCGERVMKDEDVKHCNKHLAEKDKEIEKLKKELDTANCFVEGFSQFGLEELTENRKLNELWQKRFDDILKEVLELISMIQKCTDISLNNNFSMYKDKVIKILKMVERKK